jgi:hypothetical protein
MMRAATQIANVSFTVALKNMDQTSTLISEEKQNALSLGKDDIYLALSTFEAIMIKTLSHYAYNLPPTISYKYPGGIASLVAAYDIYGDASKFEALETQNPFSFPYCLGPVINAVQST